MSRVAKVQPIRSEVELPDDPGFEILLKANQVLGVLELLSEAVDSDAINCEHLDFLSKPGFLGLLQGAARNCEDIAELTAKVEPRSDAQRAAS
jgi:hypothetical protein